MERLKILVVDDEKRVRDELDEFLTANNYIVFQAALPSHIFEIINKNNIDIMILDIRLPEMDGLEVLDKVKKSYPSLEVIMITGHGEMNSVIQAMRSGASDYLTKPFRLADVEYAIERTQKFIRLNKKLRDVEFNYQLLSKGFNENKGYQIVGNSLKMKAVIDLMGKIALSDDTTVLITGESGTGKEVVARGIHYLSKRKESYFYSVNISSIPDCLFESELFGHKKGSFTGAVEDKKGWFEIANHSTLFLDEISEMDTKLQAKLLRVLEERKIVRVGSYKEIPIDVRIIAASNKDIEELIRDNRLRKDLYHRLNAFRIHIPPLRERIEDIPILLESFIRFYSGRVKKPINKIDKNIIRNLIGYDFPGNVRELKNMAERAIILCEGDKLHLRHFPINSDNLLQKKEKEEIFDLEIIEKNIIKKALEKTNYNRLKACRLLNLSWQALDRRIKKYGLKKDNQL